VVDAAPAEGVRVSVDQVHGPGTDRRASDALVFLPLARRIRTGAAPRGFFWNLFETVLVFVRDEVARPSIGKHDADRFLPFLWNLFFFILFCNLLGILPWAGSPTGALTVTVALALIAFAAVVGTGVVKFGPFGYLKSLVRT